MRKNVTKKVLGTLAAATLCMSMTMPAMASGISGEVVPVPDGTDVYAGMVVDHDLKTDARIRVTVPTVFAFVVNGTADTSSTDKLSVQNGSIMLPNVKVNILDPTNPTSDYTIDIQQDSTMTFTNYSTIADDTTESNRKGIAVELSGAIENKGSSKGRNYWTHTATAEGFKEYNLSVDGKAFNKAKDGALQMSTPTTLAAPAVDAEGTIDDTTMLAKTGAVKELPFTVAVGGDRNQYTQIEQSAKVGSIVWTVGYKVDNTIEKIPTAPANDYLK